MSNNILIAEGGGTSVDWCLIDKDGTKKFFSTESYHPEFWSDELLSRAREFWSNYPEAFDSTLYFFSSGCLRAEKQELARLYLKSIGFKNISVQSDLHAAGIAAYGNNDGWVAILGTGSVLFKWNEGQVDSIIGGKGHIHGDEGSGYYFGKLLVQKHLNKTLSIEQNEIFEKTLLSKGVDISEKSLENKSLISSFSKLLDGYEIFQSVHNENIRLFFDSHFNNLKIKCITIIGGYAFANSDLVRKVLIENGLERIDFIERPLSKLVDQISVYNQ